MDAQLIQFHITPQLADQAANGIQMAPNSGFNLEFVALKKYVAEDLRGIPEFRREYRRKLMHVIEQFNEYFQWHAEKAAKMKHFRDSFGKLEDLSDSAKYLVSLLKSEFIIPGELELTEMRLTGEFSIYAPGSDSELKQRALQVRDDSIATFKAQHQAPTTTVPHTTAQPFPGQ